MATQRLVCLYLHTHWDREWYRSFENYRTRLCRTLLAILDHLDAHPERVFLLDGQTVVLEDFLAIHPEQAGRLQALIQAERLHVGPWYVLPDEFLVSAEALIRNLQLGVRQARAQGQQAMYGYLPDMFGHLAQMPQLLADCGLAPALIWRGADTASAWLNWEALDGTVLPAIHLTKGYYQDALHTDPPAWDVFESFLSAIAAATPSDAPLLMPIGADHMGLPPQLDARLAEAQTRFPDYDLRLTALPDYLTRLQQAAAPTTTLHGELRTPVGMAYVLPGVWSTRRYLKQANDALQNLLERTVEPLLVWQQLSGAKPALPLLGQAWKYLLLNQPHDSICGCSIDAVHQDMLPRFRASREIADDLLQIARESWGGQKPGQQPGDWLNLVNTGPSDFEGVSEAWLTFPPEEEVVRLALLDEHDQPVPLEILASEDTEVFVAEPEILPHWESVRRLHCRFVVTVPALSSRSLRIVPGHSVLQPPLPDNAPPVITNAHCRVVFDAALGQIQIYRKEDHTWVRCLEGHLFVDEGDAGDSYNYSPPQQDQPFTITAASAQLERSALSQTLRLHYHGFVPARLQEGRQSRSRVNVPLRIETTLTLHGDTPRLQVQTRVLNQAQDHRLRLLWVTPFERMHCWSGTPFGALERTLTEAGPFDMPKGQERPAEGFPFSEWIHVTSPDQSGWLLHTEGLHEASLTRWQGHAALSLTLLRCVGYLSRDDLRTRGGGAGPRMATPEAQCLGEHVFDYTLHLCGDRAEAALASLNQTRHPLQIFQGQPPEQSSLFTLAPDWLHVSALAPSQDGEGIVLRVVNENSEPAPLFVRPHFACESMAETDPLEQSQTPLSGAVIRRELAPYETVTFKFVPGVSDQSSESPSEESRL